MLSTLVSSVLAIVRTVDKARKIMKHKMLHRTRDNCDSKVILPVVAVEGKVEVFAGAIFFFWTNRKSDVQGPYLDWRPGLLVLLLLGHLVKTTLVDPAFTTEKKGTWA